MATKKEQPATNNVVTLHNKRTLSIKPTKLKYFSSGDYGLWMLFDKHGLENLILGQDGRRLALQFLSAVLDKPYTEKQIEVKDENGDDIYVKDFEFDPELEKIYDDELSLQEYKKIIDVSKEVNGISGKN